MAMQVAGTMTLGDLNRAGVRVRRQGRSSSVESVE